MNKTSKFSLNMGRYPLVFWISLLLIASRQLWATYNWSVGQIELDASDLILLAAIPALLIIYRGERALFVTIRSTFDSNRLVITSVAALILLISITALFSGDLSLVVSISGAGLRIGVGLLLAIAISSRVLITQVLQTFAIGGMLAATVSLLQYFYELSILSGIISPLVVLTNEGIYIPQHGLLNLGAAVQLTGFASSPITAASVFCSSLLACVALAANNEGKKYVYASGAVVIWSTLQLTLARSMVVAAIVVLIVMIVLALTKSDPKYYRSLVKHYVSTGLIAAVIVGVVFAGFKLTDPNLRVQIRTAAPISTTAPDFDGEATIEPVEDLPGSPTLAPAPAPTSESVVEPTSVMQAVESSEDITPIATRVPNLFEMVKLRTLNTTSPRAACHLTAFTESFMSVKSTFVGHGVHANPEGGRILTTRFGYCRLPEGGYSVESEYFRILFQHGLVGISLFLTALFWLGFQWRRMDLSGDKYLGVFGLVIVWFLVMGLFTAIFQEFSFWYTIGLLLVGNTIRRGDPANSTSNSDLAPDGSRDHK